MADSATMVGIKNSWGLLAFAKSHGKMQVGDFANKETGETFKSCIFTEPETNNRCFVHFSSKLGPLTPAEISARKNDLQVVQLETDSFVLCAVGQNNWQDVEL